MALNLLSLLQAAGQVPPQEPVSGDDILVTGRRSNSGVNGGLPENDPAPPGMSNRSYLEEAQQAAQQAPARKGMFGTRGTLRDILGTIGDAFLVQSGHKAVYQPRRDLERQADAMVGFTNPGGQLAALERLANTPGGAELAQQLYNDIQTNDLKRAQVQSLTDTRNSQQADRDFKQRETGINRLSRWVRGNLPYAQIVAGAKMYGINEDDLASLGVSPDMTPEQRAQFASGDITVNQQEQLPYKERAAKTAEQNAVSNRIRATRPPAPRAEPQPTAAAMAAPLIQKIQSGKPLSAGEEEALTRLGYSKNRGKSNLLGGPSGNPTSQGPRKFVLRNGKFVPQ